MFTRDDRLLMPLSDPDVMARLSGEAVTLTSAPVPDWALRGSDLTWVKRLDREVESRCALTNEQAEEAVHEYLRFLYLAFVTADLIAPSQVVALCWHIHMNDEPAYEAFNIRNFGRIIRHKGGQRLPKDDPAYALALRRYREEFDVAAPTRFWPRQSLTGLERGLETMIAALLGLMGLGLIAGLSVVSGLAAFILVVAVFVLVDHAPVSLVYAPDDLPAGLPSDYGSFKCIGGGCAAD
jgi:hypothetical protein